MKPDQRRSELQQRLIAAAERMIAAEGLGALRARRLAAEVGCAVGQIYNLFADLDGLVLAVNARTLDELDARLTSAAGAAPADAPGAVLLAQARAYLGFASENRRRWQAVFEHRMTGARELPGWYREQQARLFGHVDGPMRALRPDLSPDRRARLGRTVFSAVHGIVSLGIEELLGPQSQAELSDQLQTVVRALVDGLGSR